MGAVMRQPTNRAATPATPQRSHHAKDGWFLGTLSGLVSDEHLAELSSIQNEHPWTAAVRRGWASNEAILDLLAARFRMRIANLAHVSPRALQMVTEPLARRYRILPLAISDSSVDIATSDPYDLDCERTLEFAVGRNVRASLASPDHIARRLDELYRPAQLIEKLIDEGFQGVAELESVRDDPSDADIQIGNADDRPIIRLVDRIVAKAIQQRSSDIHLEPEDNGIMVRYRIDGVLKNDSVIPRALSLPLVARIKIMARLDIADRLRPQDGRARVAIAGAPVDLRISTLPAALGEKVVVRILDSRQTVLALNALGLHEGEAGRIESLLEAREGMVCVTGPTGSGKTTTLYSIVRHIQRRGVNIVTVEDPVEYRLQGIVQVQVNDKTGLTFPSALRSILRQDPDVILIGEIRDRETAQIAVQAALTGHLVLTTLHTIDAASAVIRLADVGVAGYKTAAALKGVVAQRLMRRLCMRCRQAETGTLPPVAQKYLGQGGTYTATGCDECSRTGYRGRLAIAEVLVCDAETGRRITAGESTARIYNAARLNGMQSLWESAIAHVRRGASSVDELLRVLERPADEAATPDTALVEGFEIDGGYRHPDRARASGRQVFEGSAFDLLDEYAPAAADRRPILIARERRSGQDEVRGALEANGFAVREVSGAGLFDAIDRAKPAALILDASASSDAMEMLERLRARPATSFIPALMIAPHDDEAAEVRAFEQGASDYLSKPLRPAVLAARVRALVERSMRRRETAPTGKQS
jgi:type II secretory ATPase GspE/PulE/Tfp pilus assembly ATPase PilB-like protein/CheY-like chemotaxis protein